MTDTHANRVLNYAGVTPAVPNLWLHRYAILVAVATWFLIIAGSMVTSTGSGLAVPDWPTTYGQNMFTYPYSKWVGGIFFEHGHRLIASAVGLLTIGLCIWLWRSEPRRWLCWLGTIALASVIMQGILGGLTVKYLLPTPISVAHACLAQTFLCIVVSIAVFTSSWWVNSAPARRATAPRIQTPYWGFAMSAVIFLQLVLGAIMRHTESGLAVLDFPLAYGQVLPDLSDEAVARYNDHRRFERLLPAVSRQQIGLHLVHRAGAVFAAGVCFAAGCYVLRRHCDDKQLRRPMILIMALIVAQFGLGAWTVLSERMPYVASAHVAVGAATLALAWVFTMRSYRLIGVRRAEHLPSISIAGATA